MDESAGIVVIERRGNLHPQAERTSVFDRPVPIDGVGRETDGEDEIGGDVCADILTISIGSNREEDGQ